MISKIKNIKVSVIIPVFNGSKYIIRCINSVFAQTHKNIEIIIIDDNSLDNTYDIIKNIKKKTKIIKVFKNKTNKGPAYSRNLGIRYSKGKFLAFLDCDDTWKKNKLSECLNSLTKGNYDFCYSYYKIINKNRSKFIILPENISYDLLLCYNPIKTSTFMINKKKLSNLKFPFFYYDDYALFFLLSKKKLKNICVKKYLTNYYINSNSLSSNKFNSFLKSLEVLIKQEKVSTITLIKFSIFYFFKNFTKYYF